MLFTYMTHIESQWLDRESGTSWLTGREEQVKSDGGLRRDLKQLKEDEQVPEPPCGDSE